MIGRYGVYIYMDIYCTPTSYNETLKNVTGGSMSTRIMPVACGSDASFTFEEWNGAAFLTMDGWICTRFCISTNSIRWLVSGVISPADAGLL